MIVTQTLVEFFRLNRNFTLLLLFATLPAVNLFLLLDSEVHSRSLRALLPITKLSSYFVDGMPMYFTPNSALYSIICSEEQPSYEIQAAESATELLGSSQNKQKQK